MIDQRPDAIVSSAGERSADDAASGDCPACRASQQAVDALRQQMAENEPMADAIPWLAVCNTHAWQLSGQGAVGRHIAAARLQAAVAQLDGDGASGLSGRRAGAIGAAACPFCAAMATAAERMVDATPSAQQSLCLPHLCVALLHARSRERVQGLATAAIAQGKALEQELSELIRKSDYRFRDEAPGPEATSWRRAAQLLVGVPGVHWPLRREPDIEG
ncbi:MAG TPA: hypothetical protein VIU62_22455 [Chloroflexota bacterium]